MFNTALFQNIKKLSKERPYDLAILDTSSQINYQTLNEIIEHQSQFLAENGIDNTFIIAFHFNSEINFILSLLASLKLGACIIPFHQNTPSERVNEYCQHLQVDLMLCDETFSGLEVPQLQINHFRQVQAQKIVFNKKFDIHKGNLNSLVIIGSGTSAESKIIPISSDAMQQQIMRDCKIIDLQQGERYYALSPISYYTAIRRRLACFYTGACAVFNTGNTDIIAFCNRFKVDHLALVNTHAQAIMKTLQLKSEAYHAPYLKSVCIGASPISEKTRNFLRNFVSKNTYIFYGPNEIGSATCSLLNEKSPVNSIGKAVEGIELEIVDDQNLPCPIGVTGHIRLKSPSIIKAYLLDSHQYSKRFLKDGWFYPSDLAYKDKEGNIIFQGRSDDLIIYQGNNIYPREIENVFESFQEVDEVAVFPVQLANENQAPIAVLVLNKGFANDNSLETIKKRAFLQLHHSSPAAIFAINELPKNDAGKVLKRQLKEQFQAHFENHPLTRS